MKSTKVRKKKKQVATERQIIVEPVRRSLLDVINTNLKVANRVTYLHRLIYVGKCSFVGNQDIVSSMEENYRLVNTGYTLEPLSGLMLYYQHYFCYIAEAPERVLNKHLSLLFEEYGDNLTNVKLLATVHHIKGRFLNDWMSYYGRPPQRVEEINFDCDMESAMWYVRECCGKMYKFANNYISDQLKLRSKMASKQHIEDGDEEERVYEVTPATTGFKSKTAIVERDTYSDCLPEIKLLDFLVNCKHLPDLKQYKDYYKYIGQSMDYTRKAWPASTTMVPYNVFDSPYDPIENLPPREEQVQVQEREDYEMAADEAAEAALETAE